MSDEWKRIPIDFTGDYSSETETAEEESYELSEESLLQLVSQYATPLFGFYLNKIFTVATEPRDFNFRELFRDAKKMGLYVSRLKVPTSELIEIIDPRFHEYLAGYDSVYLIRFLERIPRGPKKVKYNFILLIVTIITVFVAGIFFADAYAKISGGNVYVDALLYTFGLILIIGSHEMGHYLLSKYHGIDSSLPYFIPGPPFNGGTFGAVIAQRDPFIDRKSMVDIGAAGPLAGFLPAIIVFIVGLNMSVVVPESSVQNALPLPTPVIAAILISMFKHVVPGSVILLHPLALAGYFGFVITGLQVIPIGQLDGGHVARALLSERTHMIAGYIAAIILIFLTPYWLFSLLALFLFGGRPHPPPLDDASKLPTDRIIIAILTWIVGIISIPFWVVSP